MNAARATNCLRFEPGLPGGEATDQALIKSFHREFRTEHLNQHWLTNLEDAEERFDDWQKDYHEAPTAYVFWQLPAGPSCSAPRYAQLSIRYPHVYGHQFQFDFQRC